MPEFVYKAKDSDGRSHGGVMVAPTSGDLLANLRGRGWIVLDILPAAHAATWTAIWNGISPSNWLPVTRLDVEMGLQQLAVMVRTGLTLLSSLKTAAEQSRSTAMRRIWLRIGERIEEGATFADALAAEKRRFPALTIQLVRVGEGSGTLETVLVQAADHLERSRALRTTLLTALTYPAFVLLSAIAVSIIMVFSVIPKLEKFIVSGRHRLPAITQDLLDTTQWFHVHGTELLVGIALTLILWIVLHNIPATRRRMDAALLRIPIIGGLLRLAATASVARGLTVMLANGINLLESLQIVQGLLVNVALQRRLQSARQSVLEGGALAPALLAGREFLPMMGRMTAVGEATGALDVVMAEVARFHEAQLAAAIRRFSLLIEPVIILVVGGIVGFVYIAFFVELFSIAGGR